MLIKDVCLPLQYTGAVLLIHLECDLSFADCNYSWTWTSSSALSKNGHLFKVNVLQVARPLVSGVPYSKVANLRFKVP